MKLFVVLLLAIGAYAQDFSKPVLIDRQTIELNRDVVVHSGSLIRASCIRLGAHKMIFETGGRDTWIANNEFILSEADQVGDDLGHNVFELLGNTICPTCTRHSCDAGGDYRRAFLKRWLNLMAYLNLRLGWTK